MLGTAIQLLGLKSLPEWVQTLGDSETLRLLNQTSQNVEKLCLEALNSGDSSLRDIAQRLWPSDELERELAVSCLQESIGDEHALINEKVAEALSRARAVRLVLWRLAARRLPKLVFRLRSEVQHSGGINAGTIAERYAQSTVRFNLERRIENQCVLPIGSLFIHCPPRKTSMKIAEALVVGADLAEVAHLRDVTKVSNEGLRPYEDEIRAVEEMYRSIWQMHVYLDASQMHKKSLVARALKEEVGFPNDMLLKGDEIENEPTNPYAKLATELFGDVAPNLIPRVVALLDKTAPDWQKSDRHASEIARTAILEITKEEMGPKQPGVEPEPKIESQSVASSSAADSFSYQEFVAILRDHGPLQERELASCYRALLKYGVESRSSPQELRERVERFALSLSEPPRSADLFEGDSEDRPIAHRLPRTSRDWEKI